MSISIPWYQHPVGGFISYPREMGLCKALISLLSQPEIREIPIAIVTDQSNRSVISSMIGEELPMEMFKDYGVSDSDDLGVLLSKGEGGLVIFDSAALVHNLGLASRIKESKGCRSLIMVGWSDCGVLKDLASNLKDYGSYAIKGANASIPIRYQEERIMELPTQCALEEQGMTSSVCSTLSKGQRINSEAKVLRVLPSECSVDRVCDWVEGLCRERKTSEPLLVKFPFITESEYKNCHWVISHMDFMDLIYEGIRSKSIPIL